MRIIYFGDSMYEERETTISFEINRYTRAALTAQRLGMPLTDLIKICLKKMSKLIQSNEFQEGLRKYQDDAPEWTNEHFFITEDEYDTYLDLQKHSRCCFSLLVALAIDFFAESVIPENNLDSYPKITYYKEYMVKNNYPIYVFCHKKLKEKVEITIPKRE
jgi:hypothetical protein